MVPAPGSAPVHLFQCGSLPLGAWLIALPSLGARNGGCQPGWKVLVRGHQIQAKLETKLISCCQAKLQACWRKLRELVPALGLAAAAAWLHREGMLEAGLAQHCGPRGQGTRHNHHDAPTLGLSQAAPLHLPAGTGHRHSSAVSVPGVTGSPHAPCGPTLEPRGPGCCCLLRLLRGDEAVANLRSGAQQAVARWGSWVGGTECLFSVKE